MDSASGKSRRRKGGPTAAESAKLARAILVDVVHALEDTRPEDRAKMQDAMEAAACLREELVKIVRKGG